MRDSLLDSVSLYWEVSQFSIGQSRIAGLTDTVECQEEIPDITNQLYSIETLLAIDISPFSA